ncbi:MAG: hypothetical protein H6923_07720 [Alphaproteobacteria bacterium]|nr:hypothetical protein [Alphaproteobacteria bacterium]
MRRKSREINIFNLSMMDVISGAMGAFLIIMIVLARYYNSDPGNKENVEAIKAELQSVQARLKEIESSFRRAGIESSDITRAVSEAGREVKKAESDLDKLREQLDQAEQEIERLKEQQKSLLQRRAFAVSVNWACPGADIDLYLWDTQKGVDGSLPEPMDPRREQNSKWAGDLRAEWDDGPPEMWIVTSSVAQTQYKVYVKLLNADAIGSCQVVTNVLHAKSGRRYVSTLSAANPWQYVSRVVQTTTDDGADFTIEDPSAADVAAEKSAINTAGG